MFLYFHMMKQLFIVLFFSFAVCLCCSAQLTFNRVDTVQVIDDSLPLKNAWAGGLNYPMVEEIDLNGDGIMDLVLYEQGDLPGHDRIYLSSITAIQGLWIISMRRNIYPFSPSQSMAGYVRL